MARSLLIHGAALLLCWTSLLWPAQALGRPATVPDVEFLVLRLDYRSYQIEGGYRFSQPFRKTVLPDGFVQAGNVHYRQIPASDFGFTEIRSRLTGQQVARATTVWAGSGAWQFPSGPMEPIAGGGSAPDPIALTFVRRFGSSILKADSAWASARQAQPLEDLAATGAYEVVVFDHFYSVGLSNPATAEWIVIAFTRPAAPPDVGILSSSWPYTLVTRGVSTVAEATVYNFSDSPETFAVRLEVIRGGNVVHSSTVPAGTVASEASAVVPLAPFAAGLLESHQFSYQVVGPGGEPWTDTFADNDLLARTIGVVEEPVFRPVASYARPGPIPTDGEPLDLDGDGDLDLFQYGYDPVLWRRGPDGTYANITGLSPFVFPHHPRMPVAADFDGDAHPDLLVVYDSRAPVLLKGDGTGKFVDVTTPSGLAGVTGYFAVAVLDLEGDGDRDLIFQSLGQETVLANDGLGHFANVTASSGLVDPTQTLDVAVGDVNGDGRPDVFLTNWGGPFQLCVNDGDGTFTPAPGPWSQTYGRQALFLDADGDDRQDLFVMHESRSWLYRNLGGLSFVDVSAAWGVSQPGNGGVAGDLNDDGLPEVFLGSISGYTLLVNQGGSFADRTSLLVNVGGYYGLSFERPRFADINEDGLVDLYQRAAVYLSTGLDPPPVSVDPPRGLASAVAFPNPFSRSRQAITLGFRLPARGPVTVSVVDLEGRIVRRLLAGEAGPGYTALQWDGRDDAGRTLPPGVYFCAIEGRGSRATSRFAMLR